jgi:hypothetical protein
MGISCLPVFASFVETSTKHNIFHDLKSRRDGEFGFGKCGKVGYAFIV